MCRVLFRIGQEPGRIIGREWQNERRGREPEEKLSPLPFTQLRAERREGLLRCGAEPGRIG